MVLSDAEGLGEAHPALVGLLPEVQILHPRGGALGFDTANLGQGHGLSVSRLAGEEVAEGVANLADEIH